MNRTIRCVGVVLALLPEVPLREWVLSVPFALRRVLARDPTALTLVSRTFREELRRWLRYVARPAVVDECVMELTDGRVVYRLKQSGGRGETHRIMEPMKFMARLAALAPPPRHPLVRYHGVFAPNSPWRGAVIPMAPLAERGCSAAGEAPRRALGKEPPQRVPTLPEQRPVEGGDVFTTAEGTLAVAKSPRPTTRIDWVTLLHRVWGVDALKCPRCEGAMKFIATIHDRAVIVRILAHLRLPTDEMLPAPERRWDDTS